MFPTVSAQSETNSMNLVIHVFDFLSTNVLDFDKCKSYVLKNRFTFTTFSWF